MTFVPDRSNSGVGLGIRASEEELSVLLASHPNVLVRGSRDATLAFLQVVRPLLREPLRSIAPGPALLNLPAAEGGTLILRDVDDLDQDQQQRLLQWLDDPRSGETQVISITTTPLYGAVRTGSFLNRLYYRLNVVHFDVAHD
jgi:hypothetical protein